MKTLSKFLLVLLLVPAVSLASTDPMNGRYTKTKKVSKSFQVNSNATLLVDNSYGNIDITSWDQNRIEIDVFIKTNGNDEDDVIKALNAIEIAFESSASRVSAETIFEERDGSWLQIFSGGNNVSKEINYVIKMPVTNNADLNNDYGGININKLKGNTKINCDYGKLIIGELLGENNYLNFDYTKNSTIGYVKNAKINADYSGFEIEEVGLLELNADYTNSKVGKVTKMNFNCDYGSIDIGKVQQLTGVGDYLGTKIAEIYGKTTLNLNYGSLKIGELTSKAKELIVEADYTGVDVGYDSSLPFIFAVEASYGSIKGLDELQIVEKDKSSFTSRVEGYNINRNSENNVIINTNYGSVEFYEK